MPLRLMLLCLVIAAPSAGCVFVAKDTTTGSRVIATRYGDAVVTDRPGTTELRVTSEGPTVTVVSQASRRCSRMRYDTVAVTHDKKMGIAVIEDPNLAGAAAVLMMFGGWVLVPVSAAAAGITVASHEPTVKRSELPGTQEHFDCPAIRPGVTAVALLPSGATLELRTDGAGTARFDVPAEEPSYGLIAIEAAGATSQRVMYYRDYAACADHRDLVFTRIEAAADSEARLAFWDLVPQCNGKSAEERATDAAWDFTASAARQAARGRCDAPRDLTRSVLATDANVYDTVFMREPAIALCARSSDLSRSHETVARTECLRTRSELMRRAQDNTDIKERTKALISLPQCQQLPR